jgi:hypothetical protein
MTATGHAAGVIARPHGRDLERHELEALVRALAARPELWAAHVCHDRERRVYEELLRDDHLAVWLICWMDDHDTTCRPARSR